MANNHDGSLDHGLRIIDSIHKSAEGLDFKIAIKFQYRNLPSFIHPNFRTRTDLKYVNRFLSTKLAWDEFLVLKSHIESAGFYSACTPFDEFSVDMVIEHDFDILKNYSLNLKLLL
jgi:N-acetylneuraminate synthase